MPGGMVRLYLYQERPKDPRVGADLEECPKRIEVIMIIVCRESAVEGISGPLSQDIDMEAGGDIQLN